ncbi:MAG: hypothetical protein FWD72_06735, partial [Eggerthellaceae bacterium]|nr:hypothetical protein [Eggerthellaceae bacterium]
MEKKRKPIGLAVYAVLFMAICILPFAGMAWAPTEETSSRTGPVALPALTLEDGSANLGYLPQLGAYFEDHFAYRNLAIDLDARIKVALLDTSPNSQVIVGSDGWLYYSGELDSYLGLTSLSEREAENIAYNLMLVQGYAASRGSKLVFVVAPDKSALYPEHMPYYYVENRSPSIDLLERCLDERGVAYVDLFALFEAQDSELYCKTDSHWTNLGAMIAANALLDACGTGEATGVPGPADDAFTGDLEVMLYPVTAQPEPLATLDTGSWGYVGSTASVEDAFFETEAGGEGTLLMFRDSFGNALIPLMSPQFSTVYYSKLIPYNLTQIETIKPDYTIIERAQRHLGLLAENPPMMFAPKVKAEASGSVASSTSIETYQDGDFLVIQGWVDEACIGNDDDIFIQIESADGTAAAYAPFRMSGVADAAQANEDGIAYNENAPDSDYGFKAFFP